MSDQPFRWVRVKVSMAILQSLQEHDDITREERIRLTDMACSPDEENLGVAEAIIDELIKKIK